MHRVLFGLLVIVLVLLLAFPALAQGEGTPPESAAEALLTRLIQLLHDGTFLAFAAPFVVVATGIVKRVTPAGISAAAIALALQVVTWAVYLLAVRNGYEAQFKDVLGDLTTILTGISGIVLGSLGSAKLYNAAKAAGIPIIGYERGQPGVPF